VCSGGTGRREHRLPADRHPVPGAAARGRSLGDRPASPPGPGPRADAVAQCRSARASDQGGAVCPAAPERAGALSDTRRHGGDGHRGGAVALRQQHRAETAYVQTPSPHHPTVYQTVSWKDQALQIRASEEVRLRGGAQRPPAAAALAGGGSPRQPASGRVELAGGALRAVSDAGDGGGAAPAAAGGLRASCWDGCGDLASSGAAASTACGRSSGAAASRTASRPADGTTRAPLAHASGPGERQGGSAGGIGSSATSCIRRRAR